MPRQLRIGLNILESNQFHRGKHFESLCVIHSLAQLPANRPLDNGEGRLAGVGLPGPLGCFLRLLRWRGLLHGRHLTIEFGR